MLMLHSLQPAFMASIFPKYASGEDREVRRFTKGFLVLVKRARVLVTSVVRLEDAKEDQLKTRLTAITPAKSYFERHANNSALPGSPSSFRILSGNFFRKVYGR